MNAPSGHCEPGYGAIADAFRDGYAADPGGGQVAAVWHDGRLVADLWCGSADQEGRRPWERDTLVCLMSVAKGVTALCTHMLADRGRLEIDAPIARYWPEFARDGKEAVLVRHVLAHNAGLPYVDGVSAEEALAWEPMIRGLERQPLHTPPGSQPAYHPATMGFLLGEVIRRITGETVGAFFRRELGDPLKLDYWIGLPPALHDRCATVFGNLAPGIFGATAREPDTLLGKSMAQSPSHLLNDPRFRAAESPSINGHGTARAIAELYGRVPSILSKPVLEHAITPEWEGVEATMGHFRRKALGFMLGADPGVPLGPSPRCFGHTGAGGSVGCGDPDLGLGFAFSTNHFWGGQGLNPRLKRVADAVFATAGHA